MKFFSTIVMLLMFVTSARAFEIKLKGMKDQSLSIDNEFDGFGCKGKNLSPEIHISDVPKDAKSLAIIVFDPDAPTGGGGWYHWLAINIPPTKTSFSAGEKNLEKLGLVQTVNSYGTNVFGGACPPNGDKPHRYIFTVYALKVSKLDLAATTNPTITGYNIVANSTAKAETTFLYGRK